jgi:hypothetical protein
MKFCQAQELQWSSNNFSLQLKAYSYKKKQAYKPDSVILRCLTIYLGRQLPDGSIFLPFGKDGQPLPANRLPIYLKFHRIEFTWFHYSRTVLAFCCTCPNPFWGPTGVTRYAALRCPDFPPFNKEQR